MGYLIYVASSTTKMMRLSTEKSAQGPRESGGLGRGRAGRICRLVVQKRNLSDAATSGIVSQMLAGQTDSQTARNCRGDIGPAASAAPQHGQSPPPGQSGHLHGRGKTRKYNASLCQRLAAEIARSDDPALRRDIMRIVRAVHDG